jgi:hypothetical protein
LALRTAQYQLCVPSGTGRRRRSSYQKLNRADASKAQHRTQLLVAGCCHRRALRGWHKGKGGGRRIRPAATWSDRVIFSSLDLCTFLPISTWDLEVKPRCLWPQAFLNAGWVAGNGPVGRGPCIRGGCKPKGAKTSRAGFLLHANQIPSRTCFLSLARPLQHCRPFSRSLQNTHTHPAPSLSAKRKMGRLSFHLQADKRAELTALEVQNGAWHVWVGGNVQLLCPTPTRDLPEQDMHHELAAGLC